MNIVPLLTDLTGIYGPVGHEQPVADYLTQRWGKVCDRVWQTPVGNVVGHLGGSGPRLLLTAHMDEINMVVRSVDDEGFVWLTSCHRGTGTYHLRECLNRQAVILTRQGEVNGIFASLTGHLRFVSNKQDEAPTWDDVYVDLGLASREEVTELGVVPGCPVLYRASLHRVGRHLAMKAADARVGLAIMTAAAEAVEISQLCWDTYLVATVQEEGGLIGASSIRHDLGSFDAAIAYEVGLAGDVPGITCRELPAVLGSGPCIIHKDSSTHYHVPLVHQLEDLAVENDIAYQPVLFSGFGTDGSELMRQGIPTALLAPPTRYTHSPYELLNEDDVADCVALTVALMKTGAVDMVGASS